MHEKIRNVFISLKVIPENLDIGVDDDLLAQYLVDSFKFIEIIVQFEEIFDVELDEEDILVENFSTIRNIAQMLESKIVR